MLKLLEIMGCLGVVPGETRMLGGTAYDLDMARRAGVRGGVSYGAHPAERLLEFRPAFLLDDFRDLWRHLLAWRRTG